MMKLILDNSRRIFISASRAVERQDGCLLCNYLKKEPEFDIVCVLWITSVSVFQLNVDIISFNSPKTQNLFWHGE